MHYQPSFAFVPGPWWSMYHHPQLPKPFPTFAQNYCGSYNTLLAKNLPSFPVNYGSYLSLLYLTHQTVLIHHIVLIFGFLSLTSILALAVIVETSLPMLLMVACLFCYSI